MRKFVKKHFPVLFEYGKHLQRVSEIKKINQVKELSFEEQKKLVESIYREHIGVELNWDKLNTYTSKMQWSKLYDKNPMKTELSDKYLVREWIKEKIGEEYLIPFLGVWDSFDEINFDILPDSFVLKTNHGTGSVLIVKDKNKLNKRTAKMMFDDWMKMDYGYRIGFEVHYSPIKRKIIAESYMETPQGELQDYKFLCFGGKPYYCWVDMGRFTTHTRNVYNMKWELQPWNQEEYANYPEPIEMPMNFDKMIELATILCKEFPHVRVDFYNIEGKVYFGEMTFTNGRGLDRILPVEYDKMLGDLWVINK